MDNWRFDQLARTLGRLRTRRGAVALLAATTTWPLLDVMSSDAKKKKKKKKVKLCLNGQTITVPKKKQGSYVGQGATVGACSACVPKCSGCGGSDGCGGTCGCGANQICDGGTCQTCAVTCGGDAVACGSALGQRLTDGGTIYVCPGRYQGTFTMGSAKLIGAGKGDSPATSTILDAADGGRVMTITAGATAELIGLRITGGKEPGSVGGGVRADSGDLRITNCTITGNEADIGGGVHVGGALRLTNSTVSQNAAGLGAGVNLNGGQPSFVTDSITTDNHANANTFGGGIYNSSGNLTLVGTEISRNSAGNAGGGIQHNAGTLTLNATCRVINNEAGTAGGINNTGGTVNLNGATVSGNDTPQCVNVIGC
jgi:hypothetical protein